MNAKHVSEKETKQLDLKEVVDTTSSSSERVLDASLETPADQSPENLASVSVNSSFIDTLKDSEGSTEDLLKSSSGHSARTSRKVKADAIPPSEKTSKRIRVSTSSETSVRQELDSLSPLHSRQPTKLLVSPTNALLTPPEMDHRSTDRNTTGFLKKCSLCPKVINPSQFCQFIIILLVMELFLCTGLQ